MDTTKLKRDLAENPVATIGVASVAVASVAKLIDAVSAATGRRAYAKQVKHSIKRQQRRK